MGATESFLRPYLRERCVLGCWAGARHPPIRHPRPIALVGPRSPNRRRSMPRSPGWPSKDRGRRHLRDPARPPV